MPLSESQKKYLQRGLLIVHVTLSGIVLVGGILEFALIPPLFDVGGDRIRIKDDIFKNDPRASRDSIRRLMDIPVVVNNLIYFGLCMYFHFTGLSYILTLCVYTFSFSFILVNYMAKDFFLWNYLSSRVGGIILMISTLTMSFVANAVSLAWKRKKLYFEFKIRSKDVHRLTLLRDADELGDVNIEDQFLSSSDFEHSQVVIRKNAWVSVIWNVIALSIITGLCLILWFSRMYMSYGCFSNRSEVLLLCQMTSEVECYPCSNCTSEGIDVCRKQSIEMFHCLSPMEQVNKSVGAICLFNYNIGFFTFLLVFANIGGVFFLFVRATQALTNMFIRNVYRLYVRYLRLYHSWKYRERQGNNNTQHINIVESRDS